MTESKALTCGMCCLWFLMRCDVTRRDTESKDSCHCLARRREVLEAHLAMGETVDTTPIVG
jgi:hypothetical protein